MMPNASAPENLQTERTKAAPAARIKVKIGDAEREIFMSFGRLNELVRYVGTAEGVPELYFNPDVSRAALETLLAPRDARGRIVEGEVALIPEELDLEVVDQLLGWATEHLMDFFVRSLTASVGHLTTKAQALQGLASSLNSSASSLLKKA